MRRGGLGRRGLLAGGIALAGLGPFALAAETPPPAAAPQAATPLPIGIFEVPPWGGTDDPDRPGIALEVMALLGRTSGLDLEPRRAPASRLLPDFLAGRTALLLYTEDPVIPAEVIRIGAVGTIAMQVVLRKGAPFRTVADLAAATIATPRGSIGHLFPVKQREEVLDIGRGLWLAQHGRVDGALGSSVAIDWNRRRLGLDPADFGPTLEIAVLPVMLFVRPETDPAARAALTAALPEVQRGWDAVLARYRPDDPA